MQTLEHVVKFFEIIVRAIKPIKCVERFAAARPARELVVLDAGHELTEVLEPMWEHILPFLRRFGTPAGRPPAA